MSKLAIYSVASGRNVDPDLVKQVLGALGLSSENIEDKLTSGTNVYRQRPYEDMASLLSGSVVLEFRVGELKAGVSSKEGTKAP